MMYTLLGVLIVVATVAVLYFPMVFIIETEWAFKAFVFSSVGLGVILLGWLIGDILKVRG